MEKVSKKNIWTIFLIILIYILISFFDSYKVSQSWMDEFVELASNKDLVCVSLPFAQIRSAIKCPYEISLPLSPIDWYALIKYSSGYIGNNMHPIVVSLHNQISFFSFDIAFANFFIFLYFLLFYSTVQLHMWNTHHMTLTLTLFS